MSCEKYSGWMTDAALGELRAEPHPELLAHAMECEACREALAHAQAVRDLVERGVESLVAGEPSPQFVTRLRRRIAQEWVPVRSPWLNWGPILAGGLAVAMVLTIMVTRTPHYGGNNPDGESAEKQAPQRTAAGPALAAGTVNAARTGSRLDSARVLRVRKPPGAATAPAEIIVPPGQLAAAEQLSDAINAGRVDGNQLLAVHQDYEVPLEVKPIEIAPLEPLAPDVAEDTPAGSIQF